MSRIIFLIPLLALLGAVINGFFGKRFSKTVSGIIGCTTIGISFILAAYVFIHLKTHKEVETLSFIYFDWIKAGKFSAPFGLLIDPLSSVFLLIITGVGFLIHVYSTGYMHDDEGFSKFFAYLNLFVFFMLLLVLGNNYLMMFVGWEGVGLCSYLLIGYWFKNIDYSNAAKKAFIMNRIGDLGFLLGIFLIFVTFGSLSYTVVFEQARTFTSNEVVITSIALLLFIGAIGKSAQIPLYTWLPDAMAGPTPVSALIHAATMVTAGIYMIARSNILYTLSPTALSVIAVVGLVTALFAAVIGIAQNDIKKVLAYSTVSQLGYMFLALGVGAYTSAVFHVATHAFFKALLFLAAGSVIHAMSGEQDIRSMGGLRKALPVTFWTFVIGTVAIAGIPPFAGFFSKDEILAHTFASNKVFWLFGLIGSLITAFYMFRLLFLTFFGEFRGTDEQQHHLHESPKSMTIPLIVLAVLSVVGGFMGLPEVFGGHHALKSFLAPVFEESEYKMLPHELSHATEYMLMGVTLLCLAVVIWVAYNQYVKKEDIPAEDSDIKSPAHRVVYNKFYVDELYNALITKPLNWLSSKTDRYVENDILDGAVNLTGKSVVTGSRLTRRLQQGNIGFYIFAMVISIIIILFFTSL
jgi:NADH-quinone oxidoreductase subunit L